MESGTAPHENNVVKPEGSKPLPKSRETTPEGKPGKSSKAAPKREEKKRRNSRAGNKSKDSEKVEPKSSAKKQEGKKEGSGKPAPKVDAEQFTFKPRRTRSKKQPVTLRTGSKVYSRSFLLALQKKFQKPHRRIPQFSWGEGANVAPTRVKPSLEQRNYTSRHSHAKSPDDLWYDAGTFDVNIISSNDFQSRQADFEAEHAAFRECSRKKRLDALIQKADDGLVVLQQAPSPPPRQQEDTLEALKAMGLMFRGDDDKKKRNVKAMGGAPKPKPAEPEKKKEEKKKDEAPKPVNITKKIMAMFSTPAKPSSDAPDAAPKDEPVLATEEVAEEEKEKEKPAPAVVEERPVPVVAEPEIVAESVPKTPAEEKKAAPSLGLPSYDSRGGGWGEGLFNWTSPVGPQEAEEEDASPQFERIESLMKVVSTPTKELDEQPARPDLSLPSVPREGRGSHNSFGVSPPVVTHQPVDSSHQPHAGMYGQQQPYGGYSHYPAHPVPAVDSRMHHQGGGARKPSDSVRALMMQHPAPQGYAHGGQYAPMTMRQPPLPARPVPAMQEYRASPQQQHQPRQSGASLLHTLMSAPSSSYGYAQPPPERQMYAMGHGGQYWTREQMQRMYAAPPPPRGSPALSLSDLERRLSAGRR